MRDEDLFPDSPRVIFANAPITSVISQLRFPTILRIESEPPAEFQERVRKKFPFFERVRVDLPADLPPEVREFISAKGIFPGYSFLTEDRGLTLSLSPDQISLTAKGGKAYARWDQFFDLFRGPLQALSDIYKPSFIMRVGLRYQNAIIREKLGLSGQPWSHLLNRELLGELANPAFESALDEVAQRSVKLRLPSGGAVFLRHGLAKIEKSTQVGYLIDIDFSTTDRTRLEDAERELDRFHELAGRAFRWAISDTLRAKLGPADPV